MNKSQRLGPEEWRQIIDGQATQARRFLHRRRQANLRAVELTPFDAARQFVTGARQNADGKQP